MRAVMKNMTLPNSGLSLVVWCVILVSIVMMSLLNCIIL